VRSVEGRRVWRGRASPAAQPGEVLANVELPLTRLPADDYIVTLSTLDSAGQSVEVNRYFFRVLPR
jgi:hypothetical protein